MIRRLILILTLVAIDATAAGAGVAVDDTFLVDLPDLVVRGDQAAPVRLDRTRIAGPVIRRQDAPSLAELGPLLPSARVAVNSRGDAHAMVRGAPERHVTTYLDGIPLNLPWDERVDLASIPAVGIGAVEGRRGLVSLLDGPGSLAGSVRLLPPPRMSTPSSEVRAAAGDGGRARVEARHQRQAGDWTVLGAAAWHTRDHWPLPGSDAARFNSDRRQWSALARASRPVGAAGRLSLLAAGWTGEQGAPPERHLGPDARFWRYPVRERLIVGSVLEWPLSGRWDLGAMVALDWHRQEIDARGPDRWGAPRVIGDDYEKSWDRTASARVRLTRWIGRHAAIAWQTHLRYTHHREIASVGADEQAYAQWLVSSAVEAESRIGRPWRLRLGAGWDHAATPEAGPREPNDARDAAAFNARLTRELGHGRAVHVAASRRSRFPSLREAYSGALGRFVVNPDLGPERQDQVEVGGLVSGDRWSLEAAAFYGRLTDGIERVALDDTRFQRVNRGEIDVPGVELIARLEPRTHWLGTLQHTVIDARATDRGVDRPAEDRPAYLSRLELAWSPPRGLGASLEARVTGPRWSADGTAESGLRRLPAGVTWHARMTWGAGPVDMHARVDNVFDARVDHQTGLPGPGRQLSAGAAWQF